MRLQITVDATDQATLLETAVNKDIEDFSQWFQSIGNAPLVRFEKAILKTYLFWKARSTDAPPSK